METPTWFDKELAVLEDDLDFLSEEMAFIYVNEICRVMKEQHISQTDLATRIGKSRAYISKVMNYSPNMTIRSLTMIAKALGLRWTRPHLVEKEAVNRLDAMVVDSESYLQPKTQKPDVNILTAPSQPDTSIYTTDFRELSTGEKTNEQNVADAA